MYQMNCSQKTATCVDCGEKITYLTKSPKRCSRCNDIKVAKYQKSLNREKYLRRKAALNLAK
jgi:hypothetical protein